MKIQKTIVKTGTLISSYANMFADKIHLSTHFLRCRKAMKLPTVEYFLHFGNSEFQH